ncbi:Fanconi anemia group B protein-like [Corythoichthys intestinalis]|uniref:Fanconi anemia group B protein-like n=1 Tax=Corythoichthys intestinalis TaxID=161448 RepID=UPI0025A5AFA7|nr:Fanconi anemia group B protein-like [Corythoichthys intestinalis]XP_061799266.1 Fanconi anemia group B protein-like [Nerophis lumbriciformis]
MTSVTSTSNQLSFCGKIITFNHVVRENKASEVTFCDFSFQPEHEVFMKASQGSAVILHKSAARVDAFIKSKSVVCVQSRTSTPCVLVSKKNKKSDFFLYKTFILSDSNQLKPSIEFSLPHRLSGDVCILQGPTVLWTHGDAVFHASSRSGEVKQVPLQLSHCLIGELPLVKRQVFILGQQQGSSKQTVAYLLGSGRTVDGSQILPHPYIGITQCINVLSACIAGDVLRCTVVAATANRQLVYLENGVVEHTCTLPYESPEAIQVVDTGRNGVIFVVAFAHGNACAVWKDTFQIATQWSKVSSVHVDDYLRCGTEQILLVFHDDRVSGQLLDHFLITDLCGISYSRGEHCSAAAKMSPPPENHLTMKALESRLQSGLSALQELQGEVKVKDKVLRQSVQVLIGVVQHRKPNITTPEQEGLVALWESDDESKEEATDDETRVMPTVLCGPHIDKFWHRVSDGRMVVGVILAADSSVPAMGSSLSMVTQASHGSAPAVIRSQSRVSWLPPLGASAFLEPAAKRSKRHHAGGLNDLNTARLAVTAVTELAPLLNSACVKCNVMLHYTPRQDNTALARPQPMVLHCGQVSVDVHADFNTQLLSSPELKTDMALEDLLSLLSVLDHWTFRIDSPDHSLGDIDGWLQRRVGSKRVQVSPQHQLFTSQGLSSLSLLRWHHISPFLGELAVHSSHLQMLKLLDTLLDYLPSSCSIQPIRAIRERSSDILALALEKEVASLREFVSPLPRDEQKSNKRVMGPEDNHDPGTPEGLQSCRLAWQQDVERSLQNLNPQLDVSRYRKFIQKLSDAQLDGDLAALVETQMK